MNSLYCSGTGKVRTRAAYDRGYLNIDGGLLAVTRKRQHFVPRMHLQHFTGSEPRGQVWTYDALNGQVRSATPEQTGVENHFYSFLGIDGTMDTRIEDFLSSVESKASPVYEEILQEHVPEKTQGRADFANFLALMHVRTPGIRRMRAEFASHLHQLRSYVCAKNEEQFEEFVNGFGKHRGHLTQIQKDYIQRNMIDSSDFIVEVPKELTLDVLAASDKIAPLLFDMNWSIVKSRHGFFITSDSPVVCLNDPWTANRKDGHHGFYDRTAKVIFPLSPRFLLRLSWEEAPIRFAIERDHVMHLNRCLAAHAERYLYAHLKDKRLKKLAAEFKDKRPTIAVATTSGLRPKRFAETHVRRRPTHS
ncbi:MAG: DUF4238 domain-containing protein [Rhodospirillales bacterium]|nr:DUF4238 domain-containing protein [Rhodospirillales bacterium]